MPTTVEVMNTTAAVKGRIKVRHEWSNILEISDLTIL